MVASSGRTNSRRNWQWGSGASEQNVEAAWSTDDGHAGEGAAERSVVAAVTGDGGGAAVPGWKKITMGKRKGVATVGSYTVRFMREKKRQSQCLAGRLICGLRDDGIDRASHDPEVATSEGSEAFSICNTHLVVNPQTP
jgi:hypothetical protein